ncbi:AarF/ABC1/UbiB kinase family protein [Limibacter armeniacum]|uniref:ABC1 kinase family protein n=1 Tax=Limibacter armeniacum TaxID=466084 RepID=UPI002FE68CAB
MLFNNTVRNIQRIQQFIKVLVKYGFEDIVTTTKLNRFVKEDWQRDDRPVKDYTRWERIRMVVEELGPTFIKFAQILSNRPDLLPKPLIQEFEKLQDNVPPFDAEIAKAIIETETGKPISATFSYFDSTPLGSASIGQVHRARLINGEDVVIKIQRPEAKKQIQTDLSLLIDFVKQTESFFKSIGILNPLEIVSTFEKSMQTELDYNTEVRNIANFRRAYENDKKLYVPKPYKELTTEKMLTMEFVSGCKITDVTQLIAWGLDPKEVVENGMEIYLKQIFELGYFHADPHPGNVLVKPDGTILLLDYGMIGKLTKAQRFAFANFMVSMSKADARGMAIYLKRMSSGNEIENQKDLEQDLNELIEDFILYGDEDVQMAEITGRLQKIIYKYRLSISGSIFLILRALTILEGIGRQLYKEFDMMPMIKPYGTKLIKEQFTLGNLTTDFYYSITQMSSLFYNLPMELKSILKKARTGKLSLKLDIDSIEVLSAMLGVVVTRLNITLLVSTLIISSSIMVAASGDHLPRNAWGIPYISMVGYILAFILGLVLIFYRKKRP